MNSVQVNQIRSARRRWRWVVRVAIALIVLLVAAELYARFKLGLGDPPLMMADPDIEYLFQPSRTYHRYGIRISINAYSMRSDEFPKKKSDPNEFRVLLLGDSVINGGAWVDQREIVSEVLRRQLQERFNRPVVVGNVSASSWGPPNLLAYVKRFGLFDADLVIIVVGSEDYGDVPTFAPLGYDAPQHTPLLALQEVVQRYAPQFIWYLTHGRANAPPPRSSPSPRDIELSMEAFRQLIDLIQSRGPRVAVALHKEVSEIQGQAKPGFLAFQLAAEKRSVPIIDLSVWLVSALRVNHQPYRDYVHPNEVGHKAMADGIFTWIVKNNGLSATRPSQ